MSTEPGSTYSKVDAGDFQLESNRETAEQIQANLDSEREDKGEPKEPKAKTAAEIGREGGKA